MKFSVIMAYFKACTYSMTFLLILFYILTNAASIGSSFWLATYSDSQTPNSTKNMSV